VVDGQQRLRAIIEFAEDGFPLSKRSNDLDGSGPNGVAGLRYSSLSSELQEKFLSYAIAVDQLLNASDEDVLEVFGRLNSYSVQLNAPEKRHAIYQGDFKWAVHAASRKWSVLWEKYHIVSLRQRIRMLDDSLTAELFGILLEGIKDGGQQNINKLYKRYDKDFHAERRVTESLDTILSFFSRNLAESLANTLLLNAPHFLILFAALAHLLVGIPQGDLDQPLPERSAGELSNLGMAQRNLLVLAEIVGSDEPSEGFSAFWRASKSSTQRIASRRIRFPVYWAALSATPISTSVSK